VHTLNTYKTVNYSQSNKTENNENILYAVKYQAREDETNQISNVQLAKSEIRWDLHSVTDDKTMILQIRDLT